MGKQQREPRPKNIIATTLAVVVTALAAALLLLLSLVVWLSELLGSLVGALSLTGLVLALCSWVIYRIALSGVLTHLRQEYEQLISLVTTIQDLYDAALRRIGDLLRLFK